MGDRRGVRSGSFFRTIEPLQAITLHLVDGLVATDGVQYSSVATVGTTAVEVFSKVVDPGIDLDLKELEVSFTQRFDNLNAALVGSMVYYWQARQRGVSTQSAWISLTGTYAKNVPTSGVTGDPSEDTFSGYLPVASLPPLAAPEQGRGVEVRLMAVAFSAAHLGGQVKNDSFVTFVGSVIPGT